MVLSCSVVGCKTDEIHKVPNLELHAFPQEDGARQKWCSKLGRVNYKPTPSSRICSLHFTPNCFVGTTLKSSAVPSKFFHDWQTAVAAFNGRQNRSVKTDFEILSNINKQLSKLTKPTQFRHPLGDEKNEVTINNDTTETIKLWNIINKQVYLINKLMGVESTENSLLKELEEAKATQKELTRKVETYKYVTKCLQEKQTTLEEQIEILSAVESR